MKADEHVEHGEADGIQIDEKVFVVSSSNQGRNAFHFKPAGVDEPRPLCGAVVRPGENNHKTGPREWREKDGEILRRMSVPPCRKCLRTMNRIMRGDEVAVVDE